jgi:hypothetical protein
VSASTLSFPNIDVAPLQEIRVCRSGKVSAPTPGARRRAGADAGVGKISYGVTVT